MKLLAAIVNICCLLVSAQAIHAGGDALYQSQCAACHQPDASGNEVLGAPALGELSAGYLVRQLRNFRDDVRGAHEDDVQGRVMAATVTGLTERDIERLSHYLSDLPASKAPPPLRKPGLAGRGLYSGCASCHGSRGEGVPGLEAPRLAGQHSWYLKAQLLKFRSGQRGAHPGDRYGAQMRQMADIIPDEEAIDELLAYLATLTDDT
jgi:cytochrome c oxidase subunit 2